MPRFHSEPVFLSDPIEQERESIQVSAMPLSTDDNSWMLGCGSLQVQVQYVCIVHLVLN